MSELMTPRAAPRQPSPALGIPGASRWDLAAALALLRPFSVSASGRPTLDIRVWSRPPAGDEDALTVRVRRSLRERFAALVREQINTLPSYDDYRRAFLRHRQAAEDLRQASEALTAAQEHRRTLLGLDRATDEDLAAAAASVTAASARRLDREERCRLAKEVLDEAQARVSAELDLVAEQARGRLLSEVRDARAAAWGEFLDQAADVLDSLAEAEAGHAECGRLVPQLVPDVSELARAALVDAE